MKRRTAIKWSLLGFAALGTGILAKSAMRSFESVIFSVLEKDVKNLNVSKEDIQKYAREAAKQNPFGFSTAKIKMVSAYDQLETLGIKAGPFYSKYTQYRSMIVGNFLLSTDFFWSKLSASDKITYSGRIYSAYAYPCGNPFSDKFYPSV
jgi:hypothetical protein